MRKLYQLGLLAFCSIALSATVSAQDLSAFYNPNPDKDDVIVPMPCDLKMVFRKVYTNDSKMRMDDQKFEGGLSNTKNQVSESLNDRYIQGSFHDKEGFYYLIGKYEVNELQYNALMKDKCSTAKPGAKMRLPKTKISWFDAMNAARAYSLLLAKNKETTVSGKTKAFARLPTDSEFEFAVRGGRAVSSSQFAAPVFFTEGALKDYAWYQSPQSSGGRVNQVGKLKPNPLGIYDLLGNVQEMMQDGFYATRLGRLHGQAGGFVVRGGSFRTSAENMNSALRTEKPFYQGGKELVADDMGFRLVLSVPVMLERSDVETLNKEVASLGYDNQEKGADKTALNTISQLDKIIEESKSENQDLKTKNENLTESLSRLRKDMLEANDQRDRQRDSAIVTGLRLGGFLCSNIATDRNRVDTANFVLENLKKQVKANPDNKILKATLPKREEQLKDTEASLAFFVSYYSDHLTDLLNNYSLDNIEDQEGNAKLALGKGESALPQYIELFIDHLTYTSKHKGEDLNKLRQYYTDKCFALHDKLSGK